MRLQVLATVLLPVENISKNQQLLREMFRKVEELSLLAPLHNPANAAGVRAFKELLPDITSVVVFDTSFHTTIARESLSLSSTNKNITQKTRFVNMVPTGQVTSL